MRPSATLVGCFLFLCSAGCAPEIANRKPTYPVKGEIYVDGQPANDVGVLLHPVAGMDAANPTISQAMTGPDGKFEVATYVAADGAPEGEYRVTFSWGQLNTISMQYEADRLKGKYNDPEKSEHSIRVEQGKPLYMGRINLTSP